MPANEDHDYEKGLRKRVDKARQLINNYFEEEKDFTRSDQETIFFLAEELIDRYYEPRA